MGKPWTIVGSSVAGSSHLKQEKDCDDAHEFCQTSDGILLLAVADGAGSARYANKGARIAAKAIIENSKDILEVCSTFKHEEQWEDGLRTLFVRARSFLDLSSHHQQAYDEKSQDTEPGNPSQSEEEALQAQELPTLHDFATTLLVALVTPHGGMAAQIGDGIIVIQQDNDEICLVMEPEHGEYINQTDFLTDENYLARIQYAPIAGGTIKGIALLTDGLENLALDFASKKAHAPFFAPLLRFVEAEGTQEELAEFLQSERVCKQTDDDKTLLVAVRR